jgi:hypothetical protein
MMKLLLQCIMYAKCSLFECAIESVGSIVGVGLNLNWYSPFVMEAQNDFKFSAKLVTVFEFHTVFETAFKFNSMHKTIFGLFRTLRFLQWLSQKQLNEYFAL